MVIKFKDEHQADKWYCLFGLILRGRNVCAGGYYNAWEIF